MLITFYQERGGFLYKLQLGEAQRKRVAHTAKAAGIKVACFVNGIYARLSEVSYNEIPVLITAAYLKCYH